MTHAPTAGRRSLLVPIGVILAFGAFYAVFARVALHAFPFSGDEYSYFLQAELFARGKLHAPAPLHADLLGVDHVVMDQWVRSKYPPGTSALLALGVLAGVPWAITPLEAMATLAFVWRAARPALGSRYATITVALVGGAPLFAFQGASFYSQTATTMWLAAAFLAVTEWSRAPIPGGRVLLLLAGAAMGCAFLTRPLDAFLFGVALLAFASARVIAITAAGTLPFLAVHFAYQWLQFGSPLTDGYHAYAPTFQAIYGHEASPSLSLSNFWSGEQIWHHLDVARAFLLDWTVPGTGLLALLGARALRTESRALPLRRFAIFWIVASVAALLVTFAGYDDGARPRYLSTTLLPVAWLAAPGWDVAASALRERVGLLTTRIVGAVVALLAPLQLGAFLVVRTPYLWEREGLAKMVAARGILDGAVIVRAAYPTRYARNGPFFDRPVLYLSVPKELGVDEVAAAFPGRPIFEAREGTPWTLELVR